MSDFNIVLSGTKVFLNLENDYYGAEYWQRIESMQYEPDTQWFISQFCDSQTDFLDIGAANGAITLLASICGAKVNAFEPDPQIFSVLEKNVELNNELSKRIVLNLAAISDKKHELTFSAGANPEILSSILFGDSRKSEDSVRVLDLSDELDRIHADKARKLVLKMDIEGAEWKTLRSRRVLMSLAAHESILLLAVHPGFAKPIPPFATKRLIFRLPWLVRQMQESLDLFERLSEFGVVFRTNLNPISNKFKFTMLVISGYHEFVIRFGDS
jgi:FkbM family methyltransferase